MVTVATYLAAAVVLVLVGSLAVLATIFDVILVMANGAINGCQWVRRSIADPDTLEFTTSTKMRKVGWWSQFKSRSVDPGPF